MHASDSPLPDLKEIQRLAAVGEAERAKKGNEDLERHKDKFYAAVREHAKEGDYTFNYFFPERGQCMKVSKKVQEQLCEWVNKQNGYHAELHPEGYLIVNLPEQNDA